MRFVGARPLDPAELIQAPVRHAGVHGREAATFIPDLLRRRVAKIATEASRELANDVDVVDGARRRLERTPHSLHAALAVRHRAFGLRPAGRSRQHDVSELGGLRQEDVLDDQVVEAAEQANRTLLVRLAPRRILADDVCSSKLTVLHRFEHLAQVVALLVGELGATPCTRELGVDIRVLEVLETRHAGRNGAHVTAALHIVLTPQGIQPAAVPADLSSQQREVDQRQDVVRRVVVLGDAERPADHRAVGAGVSERDLLDRRCGNRRLALADFERVPLYALGVLVKAARGSRDELGVRQPRVDDDPGHRVGKRDVAAHVEAEPDVRPLRRARPARVDGDQARASSHTPQQVVKEDRVRLPRVRSPQEDEVSLFSLTIRRRSSSGSEHCRQTGDARGVSSPVAAVDVVAVHDGARELLRHEVHLVGRF
jgi:hypothetical protein